MKPQANFPVLLESFFTQRLINQRQASPHTLASYRDTFRLLLQFAQQRLHREPSQLRVEDLDAPLIGAFLDHLEKGRSNVSRTRNLRLTAIRSFFRYAAYQQPTHSAQIQRVLAIPNKRQARPLVGFLTRPEIEALLAAPNQHTWGGRRDHAFLLMALQTGLRLSEMTALCRQDLVLGTGAYARCQGKGRKERCTPLGKQTATVLKAWLREPVRGTSDILFPNARGGRLSADGVQYLVAQTLGRGPTAMSFTAAETRVASCASPFGGDGTAAGRCGSFRDCSLVGSRIGRNHSDLSRCQSRSQGGSSEKDYTSQRQGWSLPSG